MDIIMYEYPVHVAHSGINHVFVDTKHHSYARLAL